MLNTQIKKYKYTITKLHKWKYTNTLAQLYEFCRRAALVPSVTTRQQPRACACLHTTLLSATLISEYFSSAFLPIFSYRDTCVPAYYTYFCNSHIWLLFLYFSTIFLFFSHTEIQVCLHTTLLSATLISEHFYSAFLPLFSTFLLLKYKNGCILHFFLQLPITFSLLFYNFSLVFYPCSQRCLQCQTAKWIPAQR